MGNVFMTHAMYGTYYGYLDVAPSDAQAIAAHEIDEIDPRGIDTLIAAGLLAAERRSPPAPPPSSFKPSATAACSPAA